MVSDTDPDEENSLKELMELEIRTMERLIAHDGADSDEEDAWKDRSEDDEWEDESEGNEQRRGRP